MISGFVNLIIIKWIPFLTVAVSNQSPEEKAPHLPSFISLLHEVGLLPPNVYHFAETWINVIFAFLTGLIFVLFSLRVYVKRKMIPDKGQNFLEILVEWMYNFVYSILGDDAKRYTPFVGTLFFYILMNNLWGLIPGGHSPSTSINTTVALAILVFLYAQYTGVRRLGIVRYLDHFAGEPRSIITWCLVPLLFPIHIIGELAKPFSLAVRLFGNVTGEDVLVSAFVGLGLTALSFIHSPVGLPLNVPFIFLSMLLSTIQALIFAVLAAVYLFLMLPHEEHH
ncbi:MAG: F0F1 ATP synthase subunit A [FCB group bacterium]|nr:F0F1 ATP synthase subunit A [FCB group bacterium]